MMQPAALQKKSSANCACAGRKPSPAQTAARPGNQALLQRAAQRRDEQPDATPEGTPSLDDLGKYNCKRADPNKPPSRDFTREELRKVKMAYMTAKSFTSQAYGKLANRDPYHLKIAERTFQKSVDIDTIDKNVAKVKAKLDGLDIEKDVTFGTCDNPACSGGTIAYTPMPLTTITLCPFFFLLNPVSQAITFAHEAGHMAKLDPNWKPGSEVYCYGDETVDCGTAICPASGNLLENVDAWARFVYCVSLT